MQTVSFSGIMSISKIAIRLLLNSFILGPLAIIYALLAEAMLAPYSAVLVDEPQMAVLAILFGGFFCSFACMAASMLILLPIALFELHKQSTPRTNRSVFGTYLPVPVLLLVVLAVIFWGLGSFNPLQHELLAILISFYLTACTGLFFATNIVSKNPIKQ